jgi:hypothetical protein
MAVSIDCDVETDVPFQFRDTCFGSVLDWLAL